MGIAAAQLALLAWTTTGWTSLAQPGPESAVGPVIEQQPAPEQQSEQQSEGRPDRPTPAALLADLLARLELGLQAEVIEFGLPLVRRGGPLADDGQAIAAVARALFASGAEVEADALLAEAAPTPETAALVTIEQARIALERDDLDAAQRLLQAAPGSRQPVLFPDAPDAWLLLARVHARRGRLDAAAGLARRVLEMAPLHPEAASAWHLLSRDAVARQDAEAAAACLERADFLRRWHDVMRARRLQIRLTPQDPLPRLGLALGWLQVERYGEARAVLEQLAADHPDFCRAYLHLGEACRLSGDPTAASAAYSRGLECDPTDLRLLHNRGLLAAAGGRLEDGLADLRRIVESERAEEPEFLESHLAYARLLAESGADEVSAAAYERYRSLGGTGSL
jgi:tetratricopeptide (TPR) repeat protein